MRIKSLGTCFEVTVNMDNKKYTFLASSYQEGFEIGWKMLVK